MLVYRPQMSSKDYWTSWTLFIDEALSKCTLRQGFNLIKILS